MADILTIDTRALPDTEPNLTIAPGEDVREHEGLHNHGVIAISFPKFRDGRGYSSARILREAGFNGDIRAVGDITVDQLVHLKRVGFSSIAPDRPFDPAVAEAALNRFPAVYQKAADGAVPAWALRHPKESAQ